MKKYKFRISTYLSCAVINAIVIGLGYFTVPVLLNFPPYSETLAFQLKVENSTHFQQYVLIYVLFTTITLLFISFLYRNIFKLYEDKPVKKTLNEIRQDSFSIINKLMIFEIMLLFTFISLMALTASDTTLNSKIKMIITYTTIAGCIAVLSDFILSPGLKRFVIWSSTKEENYVFNYKKARFENRVLQRILPLIMIVIVIVSFLSYSAIIKEVGIKNYNYYRGEIQRLDLNNLTLEQVLIKLNSVNKLNEKDFYIYSLDQEEYIGEKNQSISLFVTEYIKDFSEKTKGHIYDFFGVETEGYVQNVQLISGETVHIGYLFSTSDSSILLLYIAVFILVITLSILYLKAFVDTISRDIKDVSSNLNIIAQNEKNVLVEKIPISSNDEIGEIVSAYNKIQDLNQSYIHDLNLSKERAEKANNYKTEFLSNMSHEIRTPLNAIVGLSQSLITNEQASDMVKQDVKDIVMASNILLDIVNGVLDISKIEANKLEIINREYRPLKMFEELVILTKARMGEKHLDFRINFDPSIPDVLFGDQARTKQVIINLLTNAVKYTNEGFISFNVNSIITGDICRLIISIEDSGVGIKPEKINKLFQKFERFSDGNTTAIEGTGLGLAITKKLVELMGGQVVAQSVFGKGSKFTVALNQRIVKVETIKEDNLISTQEIKIIDFSTKKVLVVDDNNLNLKVAQRLLLSFNLYIETVPSGYECINKIKAGENYDLILLDDMMPNMSGTETLQILKQDPDFKTPVVALTANALSGMREKYLESGFNDYLAKPIDKSELYRVLIEYLSNSK